MDDAMFNDLTRSLEQAAAHARGETVPGLHVHVHVPREVDVAAIRKATDLSQDVFARRIGVAVGTCGTGSRPAQARGAGARAAGAPGAQPAPRGGDPGGAGVMVSAIGCDPGARASRGAAPPQR